MVWVFFYRKRKRANAMKTTKEKNISEKRWYVSCVLSSDEWACEYKHAEYKPNKPCTVLLVWLISGTKQSMIISENSREKTLNRMLCKLNFIDTPLRHYGVKKESHSTRAIYALVFIAQFCLFFVVHIWLHARQM